MIFSSELCDQAQKVLNKFAEKNLKISTAESCTGGLLSALLTEISGSSKVFDRGFVTYSNQAKNEMLGVKKETLESFGAVSKEVAKEMAEGALKNSKSDVSLAITGIAGPTGDSKRKSVGLVFIATCFDGKTLVQEFNFSGNRGEVRISAVASALEMLLRLPCDTAPN